jgi:hypothetical protein
LRLILNRVWQGAFVLEHLSKIVGNQSSRRTPDSG